MKLKDSLRETVYEEVYTLRLTQEQKKKIMEIRPYNVRKWIDQHGEDK